MPRALRSFEPGGLYHPTAHGNNGRAIVLDEEDVRDKRAKEGLDPVRWTWLAAAGAVRTAA